MSLIKYELPQYNQPPPKPREQSFHSDNHIWFGKYKGKKLKDLPPDYRFWLYENIGPEVQPYLKHDFIKLTVFTQQKIKLFNWIKNNI